MRSAVFVSVAILCAGTACRVASGWNVRGKRSGLLAMTQRGMFNECLAQLARLGIAVTPPPAVITSEKSVGFGSYDPVPQRVVLPPWRETAKQAREELFQVASELMTGGAWKWRQLIRRPDQVLALHRLHSFGVIYHGVIRHLQAQGVLRPGRVDDETRFRADRIAVRSRIAFLRYYAERVEPGLRPTFRLYERVVRGLTKNLSPRFAKLAALPDTDAKTYYLKQKKWLTRARSGRVARAAFLLTWMVRGFGSVDAGTHVRELPDLRVKGK